MALIETPAPELGAPAPPFALRDPEGREHALSSLRGPRGMLVMFICNHCPYVKAVIDRLVDDCRELLAEGIGVVAINPNDARAYPEDRPEAMAQLAREKAFPFPYLVDDTQQVARAYGAVCTPDFYGYDADLALRYRGRLDSAHRGEREPGTRRELVEAMRAIAAGRPAQAEQWPSMGCSIKWSDSAVR